MCLEVGDIDEALVFTVAVRIKLRGGVKLGLHRSGRSFLASKGPTNPDDGVILDRGDDKEAFACLADAGVEMPPVSFSIFLTPGQPCRDRQL